MDSGGLGSRRRSDSMTGYERPSNGDVDPIIDIVPEKTSIARELDERAVWRVGIRLGGVCPNNRALI